ncbi:hypothetical protein XENTR_v10005880 [Xenopus tropicalis]|nr:hypothetical protein XENTR_v10005880 [Xenopus tropicalis]
MRMLAGMSVLEEIILKPLFSYSTSLLNLNSCMKESVVSVLVQLTTDAEDNVGQLEIQERCLSVSECEGLGQRKKVVFIGLAVFE